MNDYASDPASSLLSPEAIREAAHALADFDAAIDAEARRLIVLVVGDAHAAIDGLACAFQHLADAGRRMVETVDQLKAIAEKFTRMAKGEGDRVDARPWELSQLRRRRHRPAPLALSLARWTRHHIKHGLALSPLPRRNP